MGKETSRTSQFLFFFFQHLDTPVIASFFLSGKQPVRVRILLAKNIPNEFRIRVSARPSRAKGGSEGRVDSREGCPWRSTRRWCGCASARRRRRWTDWCCRGGSRASAASPSSFCGRSRAAWRSAAPWRGSPCRGTRPRWRTFGPRSTTPRWSNWSDWDRNKFDCNRLRGSLFFQEKKNSHFYRHWRKLDKCLSFLCGTSTYFFHRFLG